MLQLQCRRSCSMDRRKSREKTTATKASTVDAPPQISFSEAFIVNLFCVLGLALAFCVANNGYSIDLATDPSRTLFFIWIVELPIVILLYSRYRQRCTYLRAVGRGMLGVPVGALLNSLGAIVLGAPVTFQYLSKTVNWSLMMSLFTIVPASCVLGSSWADWRRIFAQTKPNGSVEYLICLPAHGAVIGGWFGAWPMPLDWERPWQEWPTSVSYGAIAGYLVALVASCGFVLVHVFNWTGTHTVGGVSKADYDSCNTKASAFGSNVNETEFHVNLLHSGPRYFICTVGEHCLRGMKFNINVESGNAAAPPPGSSAPTLSFGILSTVLSITLAYFFTCI